MESSLDLGTASRLLEEEHTQRKPWSHRSSLDLGTASRLLEEEHRERKPWRVH